MVASQRLYLVFIFFNKISTNWATLYHASLLGKEDKSITTQMTLYVCNINEKSRVLQFNENFLVFLTETFKVQILHF